MFSNTSRPIQIAGLVKSAALCFLLAFALSVKAQSNLPQKIIQDLASIKADSSAMSSEDVITDSMRLAETEALLAESRLNEANLRMEIEQIKLSQLTADSVKRQEQKHRIDSLRRCTAGAPVLVEDDTVFLIYARSANLSPQERAKLASAEITRIGKSLNAKRDSIKCGYQEDILMISSGNDIIIGLSEADAMWADCSLDSLGRSTCIAIDFKLEEMHQNQGFWALVRRAFMFVLTCLILWGAWKLINRLFRKLRAYVREVIPSKLKPISIQGFELLNTDKQVQGLLWTLKMLRYCAYIVLLIFIVPIIFSIFPQTKDLAYRIFSYIWDPIYSIIKDIVNYIPNLFTIIIICLVIKYLIRFFKYLAEELEANRLKINGFYPDWARPTYYIIRFLLYAFMIAMIYPYLPGSSSGVFQGLSVFIGLIVSIGSSTVIGNIIAGLVITYMRPFKLGDRIKLQDTEGNVVEKTPLVTRIKTPKNEIVTIPNSFVMSTHSVNFSQSAREYGLILHTEVTIGYDVPWREVHDMLISAALATPGIEAAPRPFVLETGLSDYYPVYQLNAYTRNANQMGNIYSALHQNIQDIFAKAGVEIMSPQYVATRDGNASTIPATPKAE